MGEPNDYPAWCLSSNRVYDHFNTFENARRRACLHLNIPYLMNDFRSRSMRQSGVFWVRIESNCKHCNNRHTQLPLQEYLLWQGAAPFLCDDKGVVQSVRMEADQAKAVSKPAIKMPTKLTKITPPAASVTSGGFLTVNKLQKDLDRLSKANTAAEREARGMINFVEKNPAPVGLFPELGFDRLHDKVIEMQENYEALEEMIKGQMEQLEKIEEEGLDDTSGEKESNVELGPVLGAAALTSTAKPTSLPIVDEVVVINLEHDEHVLSPVQPVGSLQEELERQGEGTLGGQLVIEQEDEDDPGDMSAILEEIQERVFDMTGQPRGNQGSSSVSSSHHTSGTPSVSTTTTAGTCSPSDSNTNTPSSSSTASVTVPSLSVPVSSPCNSGISSSSTNPSSSPNPGFPSVSCLTASTAVTWTRNVYRDCSVPIHLRHASQQHQGGISPGLANGIAAGLDTLNQLEARQHRAQLLYKKTNYENSVKLFLTQVSTLEGTVASFGDRVTWEALRFARGRKGEVMRDWESTLSKWGEYLESLVGTSGYHAIFRKETHDHECVTKKLTELEKKLCETEMKLISQPAPISQPRPAPSTYVERLSFPTFSGEALDYQEFKRLFLDLMEPLQLKDSASIEYLKKSMPANLKDLLKGARELQECWNRLDERFCDRPGAIRQILRRLQELDASKGKSYERVEKVVFAIKNATYLLENLDAACKLHEDLNLVGLILKKLPHDLKREWTRHVSEVKPEPIPGVTEWPVFMDWLETQKKVALKERFYDEAEDNRSSSSSSSSHHRSECRRCSSTNHRTADCPRPATLDGVNAVTGFRARGQPFPNKAAEKAAFEQAMKDVGPCPDCDEVHFYKRTLGKEQVDWPSDQMRSCPRFLALSPVERGNRIEAAQGCPKCTSRRHRLDQCWNRQRNVCKEKVNGQVCDRPHDTMLHHSKSNYCVSNAVINASINKQGEIILLGIQRVRVMVGDKETWAVVFYDSGSTLTLCLHKWARAQGLSGRPVTVYLCVLRGQYEAVQTMEYDFEMVDVHGGRHWVTAVGLDKLTKEAEGGNIKIAFDKFPGVNPEILERPEGEVEVLIGQDYAGYLPEVEERSGHLLLLRSFFGTGLLLSGRVEGSGRQCGHQVLTLSAVRMSKASRLAPQLPQLVNLMTERLPSFFEAEELGCRPPAACPAHRAPCDDCTFRGERLTAVERAALQRMEESLVRRPDGRLQISYPFNKKAFQQQSNIAQVKAIQQSVDRSVIKKGILEEYHREIQKAIEADTIVKISAEEDEAWKGPVHYVSYFPVINLESSSTKVRVVSNSKMVNAHTGHSFNDTVEPVPSALNDIFDVYIKWRGVPVALMYDLSKAYNSIATGELEKHLRRIVYKDQEGNWGIYGFNATAFGDEVAPCALEVCKARTRVDAQDIDSMAADQLVENGYVDDIAGGGTQSDVERMRGDKRPDGTYTGTLPKVLAMGGFRAKALVVGGQCDQEEADSIGGKFLGLPYCPKNDVLQMKVITKIRAKSHSKSKGKATEFSELNEEFASEVLSGATSLSRRKVLRLVMSQYDPLGFLAPLTLRAKLLLRDLYQKGVQMTWDQPLSQEQNKNWLDFLSDSNRMEAIEIPRSIHPEAGLRADIVAFWDGSTQALGACVYVRWEMANGEVSSGLVAAKSRVAPVAGATIQRMELQGLMACARLTLKVVAAMPFSIRRVTMCGDSMCAIMAVRRHGINYRPFFQNRLQEIQRSMEALADKVEEVEPLQKIAGQLNPADLGTRGLAREDQVGTDSVWMKGPSFLMKERQEWPICVPEDDGSIPAVPEAELRPHCVAALVVQPHPPLEAWLRQVADRVHSLPVLLRLVARVIQGTFHGVAAVHVPPTDRLVGIAERVVQACFMREVEVAWKAGKLDSLSLREEDGLVVTQGRFRRRRLVEMVGKPYLVVLMASCRLAELYTIQAHEENHSKDPHGILARTRRSVWIVRGRALASRVAKSCLSCRRSSSTVVQQMMGLLPAETLKVDPAFTYCCVDLFGPLETRGVGGYIRKTFKTWGVLFTCMGTKAVAIWLAEKYDTNAFLGAFQKQTAIYGRPRKVVSDRGSQIMAAGRDMAVWEELSKQVRNSGTTWHHVPASCQWRNGQAERSVAMAKECLKRTITKHELLNYVELETALLRVASILNMRPISARVFCEDEFHAVCPADLLLGRITGYKTRMVEEFSPEGEIMEVSARLAQVNSLVEQWWEKWAAIAFPLLCPRAKWKAEVRNLREGDIVMEQLPKKLGKDAYKLARVLEVHPDEQNIVRTVTIGIRKVKPNEDHLSNAKKLDTKVTAVQRLVLVLPVEEVWQGDLVGEAVPGGTVS